MCKARNPAVMSHVPLCFRCLILASLMVAGTTLARDLIPCPDCGEMVSPRAVYCPHCGCPGQAIAAEAAKRAEETKLKPVVKVVTPGSVGFGVAVLADKKKYVIMDADLLGELESLKMEALDKEGKGVSYARLELADSISLARFTVISDRLEYRPVVRKSGGKPANYLLPNGGTVSRPQPAAIAAVDNAGRLLGVKTKSQGFVSLGKDIAWKQVLPSEYRAQIKLLHRLEAERQERALSKNELKELNSVEWLTQFMKDRAKKIKAKQQEQ